MTAPSLDQIRQRASVAASDNGEEGYVRELALCCLLLADRVEQAMTELHYAWDEFDEADSEAMNLQSEIRKLRERAEQAERERDAETRTSGYQMHQARHFHERAARAESELALANENLRIREESQIPMVPRGAQVRLDELEAENRKLREALDFIASDATIVPNGCPEPWRSTMFEWVQAANETLAGGSDHAA